MVDQAARFGWAVVPYVRDEPDLLVVGEYTEQKTSRQYAAVKAGVPIVTEADWAEIMFTGELPRI